MDISSKIGTYTVTLTPQKPDIKLINYMTMNHAPLTPDLFPYYAGTWTEDASNNEVEMLYEDWIENERIKRLEQEVNEDGTLISDEGAPFNDMQEVSKITLVEANNSVDPFSTIIHNHLSNQILEDFSKQREKDLALLNDMDKQQHDEIVNKFSTIHHEQAIEQANKKDIHETEFNDLSKSDKPNDCKISEPVFATKPINEPKTTDGINLAKAMENNNVAINNEVNENISNNNKQEASLNTNVTPITPITPEIKNIDDVMKINDSINELDLNLPDIGHDPVFVTKAKDKNDYYDTILEEYNNLIKNKTSN